MNNDELVAVALLGTALKPVPALDYPELEELVVSTKNPEETLLTRVALKSLYEKAGQKPVKVKADIAAAPDEVQETTNPAMNTVFLRSLEDHVDVVEEWLSVAAKKRMVLAPSILVAALEAGTKNHRLQSAVLKVLSLRGYWLASQNPIWSKWVKGADEAWKLGQGAARLSVMKELRHSDPEKARQTLLDSWTTESAADLSKTLDEAFVINISDDDIPVIEKALGHRAESVRDAAALLSSHLPASKHSQDMMHILKDYVHMARNTLTFDIHDNTIVQKVTALGLKSNFYPGHAAAENQWALECLVHASPLDFWTDLTGKSISQLMKTTVKGLSKDDLRTMWYEAARRQTNDAWMIELIKTSTTKPLYPQSRVDEYPNAQALYAALKASGHEKKASLILSDIKSVWSVETTLVAWKDMVSIIRDKRTFSHATNSDFARYGNPEALSSMKAHTPSLDLTNYYQNELQKILDVFAFRATLLKAFSDND